MLSIFRTNNAFAAFLVAIYAILLNLHGFIIPIEWEPLSSGILSIRIHELIPINSLPAKLLAVTLIILQSFWVNYIVNQFKISRTNTFFPALFYVFVLSLLNQPATLSPQLLSLTFFIPALYHLFGTYKQRDALGKIFNVGFWIAISSLFYFSMNVYLLLGVIGLSALLNLGIREVIVMILGFLTPYYLAATFFFWVDGLGVLWMDQFSANYGNFVFIGLKEWMVYPKFVFTALLILISIVNIPNLLSKTKIQIQKYIGLLFWSLFVAIFSLAFQIDVQPEHLIIICVPLSVFLSLHFLNIRNKPIAEFLHVILLIFFFIYQYWDVMLGVIRGT